MRTGPRGPRGCCAATRWSGGSLPDDLTRVEQDATDLLTLVNESL